MPINKNKLRRFLILDKLLQRRHNNLCTLEMARILVDELSADTDECSMQRNVQKDIKEINETPELYGNNYVDDEPIITSQWVTDAETGHSKQVWHYNFETYGYDCSIFKRELTDDERVMLIGLLESVGQFRGLDNFAWLNGVKENNLSAKSRKKSGIISFDVNPRFKNSDYLARLFTAIFNKQVLHMKFRNFNETKTHDWLVSPYLLKEHDGRWFLLGWPEGKEKIYTLSVDRIEEFCEDADATFRPCPVKDFNKERFDEIIGVTFYDEEACNDIYFWVSNRSIDYIETLPIHPSQRRASYAECEKLKKEIPSFYPDEKEGKILKISCRHNYELMQHFAAYIDQIEVLWPERERNEMAAIVSNLAKRYGIKTRP